MTEIRPMTLPDVEEVVRVHLASFPGFFLSFMGAAFLKVFYAALVGDPAHIAHVAVQEGAVTGFVAGTTQPSGFYKRMLLRHGPRFLLASAGPILKRPSTLLRLARRFFSSAGTGFAADEALLMSIGVDPGVEGRGVGRALAGAFIQEARDLRVGRISLTTDKINNDHANRFYQRLGFQFMNTHTTAEGREMNEYLLVLL